MGDIGICEGSVCCRARPPRHTPDPSLEDRQPGCSGLARFARLVPAGVTIKSAGVTAELDVHKLKKRMDTHGAFINLRVRLNTNAL